MLSSEPQGGAPHCHHLLPHLSQSTPTEQHWEHPCWSLLTCGPGHLQNITNLTTRDEVLIQHGIITFRALWDFNLCLYICEKEYSPDFTPQTSDEGFDLKKRILCLYPSAEASYLSVSPTKPEGKRHSKARQLLLPRVPSPGCKEAIPHLKPAKDRKMCWAFSTDLATWVGPDREWQELCTGTGLSLHLP